MILNPYTKELPALAAPIPSYTLLTKSPFDVVRKEAENFKCLQPLEILGPARCYRQIKNEPYSESQSYCGVPDPKMMIYDVGMKRTDVDECPFCVHFGSWEKENVSTACNNHMAKFAGNDAFHFRFRVCTFHVLRINKMLSCAGADRLQTEMSGLFRKPMGQDDGNAENGSESSEDQEEEGGDRSSDDQDEDQDKDQDDNGSEDPADDVQFPVIELSVNGELIPRGSVRRDRLSGYRSLASVVRERCPYVYPLDVLVQVMWPWPGHIPVYIDELGEELNPRERWEMFLLNLRKVLMVPIEHGDLPYTIVSVPIDDPSEVAASHFFYNLIFLGTGTRADIVRKVRKNCMGASYLDFFWIIHTLWASWKFTEPLDAEDVTESNVVHEDYNAVREKPDLLVFLGEDGDILPMPNFLTSFAEQRRGSLVEVGDENL